MEEPLDWVFSKDDTVEEEKKSVLHPAGEVFVSSSSSCRPASPVPMTAGARGGASHHTAYTRRAGPGSAPTLNEPQQQPPSSASSWAASPPHTTATTSSSAALLYVKLLSPPKQRHHYNQEEQDHSMQHQAQEQPLTPVNSRPSTPLLVLGPASLHPCPTPIPSTPASSSSDVSHWSYMTVLARPPPPQYRHPQLQRFLDEIEAEERKQRDHQHHEEEEEEEDTHKTDSDNSPVQSATSPPSEPSSRWDSTTILGWFFFALLLVGTILSTRASLSVWLADRNKTAVSTASTTTTTTITEPPAVPPPLPAVSIPDAPPVVVDVDSFPETTTLTTSPPLAPSPEEASPAKAVDPQLPVATTEPIAPPTESVCEVEAIKSEPLPEAQEVVVTNQEAPSPPAVTEPPQVKAVVQIRPPQVLPETYVSSSSATIRTNVQRARSHVRASQAPPHNGGHFSSTVHEALSPEPSPFLMDTLMSLRAGFEASRVVLQRILGNQAAADQLGGDPSKAVQVRDNRREVLYEKAFLDEEMTLSEIFGAWVSDGLRHFDWNEGMQMVSQGMRLVQQVVGHLAQAVFEAVHRSLTQRPEPELLTTGVVMNDGETDASNNNDTAKKEGATKKKRRQGKSKKIKKDKGHFAWAEGLVRWTLTHFKKTHKD